MNLALILLKTEPEHPLFDAVQKKLGNLPYTIYTIEGIGCFFGTITQMIARPKLFPETLLPLI